MDPIAFIEDNSSQRAEGLVNLGVPQEWAMPATIAMSVGSILLRFLFPF
ncbi:hypothetical protein [Corynebacterium hylobatis]|nr:hypothetical protein [Corynebacterium hylobatis]